MLTFEELPIEDRRELVVEMNELLMVSEVDRLTNLFPNDQARVIAEVEARMERYKEVLAAALKR